MPNLINDTVAAQYGFLVALFDVLGFERTLARIGLANMKGRYDDLISGVDAHNKHMVRLFGDMEWSESAYWTAEGDIFIFNKVRGAYASDSILLWADRTWPKARGKTLDQLAELSKSSSTGWNFCPIPCDKFLDVCNEMLCHGIEVGLPLRGAVALGDAYFEEDRNVYLGQPIIESARLEKAQCFIGASLTCPGIFGPFAT